MKIETQTLTCTYIDTCYPDYLQDHHNRENELLILACPSFSKDSIYEDFWNAVNMSDKVPSNISTRKIKAAIREMVDSLLTSEIRPSRNLEYSTQEGWNESAYIYACLSW